MKTTIIFISFILLPFYSIAQLKVNTGTQIKINNGTIVNFVQSDSLQINSNASIENNGIIKMPFNYVINEATGYPIWGLGYENIPFFGILNSSIKPGNLGFSFITNNFTDTLYLERHHQNLPGFSLTCINRYFKVYDNVNNPINIFQPEFYADTTEDNNNPASFWHLIGYDLNIYTNYGTDTSGQLFSLNSDSINTFVYFSLIGGSFGELSNHQICYGDTIFLDVSINGAYENNSEWIAYLSDSSGSFSTISFIDTANLVNGLINFVIPTSGLNLGINYMIQINSPQPIWNFEIGTYSINPTPPIPNLSIQFDTIYINNHTTENITWYLNGNLILGENNSFIVVNTNGDYGVEFSNIFGCTSYTEITYNTLNLEVALLEEFNKIFPNPSKEYFYFVNNENAPKVITLYSLEGKLILSLEILPGKNQIFINNENLPAGLYLIKDNNKIYKLVIE